MDEEEQEEETPISPGAEVLEAVPELRNSRLVGDHCEFSVLVGFLSVNLHLEGGSKLMLSCWPTYTRTRLTCLSLFADVFALSDSDGEGHEKRPRRRQRRISVRRPHSARDPDPTWSASTTSASSNTAGRDSRRLNDIFERMNE